MSRGTCYQQGPASLFPGVFEPGLSSLSAGQLEAQLSCLLRRGKKVPVGGEKTEEEENLFVHSFLFICLQFFYMCVCSSAVTPSLSTNSESDFNQL